MQNVLFAAFADREHADRALQELETHGFNPRDLSVITKEGATSATGGTASSMATGLAEGAVAGGIIGGAAGLLAGAGVFPALAGFLIGGPIAAALGLTGMAAAAATGAMTGAVAGGLIGALMGLGFSREEAEYYHQTVEEGGLLLVVPVDEATETEARGVLLANYAEQVKRITVSRYGIDSGERTARTDALRDTERESLVTSELATPAPARETRRRPGAMRRRTKKSRKS